MDASVTLGWFFEDERSVERDALLDQVAESGATVPSLWRLEVANALLAAFRRGRLQGLVSRSSDPALGKTTDIN